MTENPAAKYIKFWFCVTFSGLFLRWVNRQHFEVPMIIQNFCRSWVFFFLSIEFQALVCLSLVKWQRTQRRSIKKFGFVRACKFENVVVSVAPNFAVLPRTFLENNKTRDNNFISLEQGNKGRRTNLGNFVILAISAMFVMRVFSQQEKALLLSSIFGDISKPFLASSFTKSWILLNLLFWCFLRHL